MVVSLAETDYTYIILKSLIFALILVFVFLENIAL